MYEKVVSSSYLRGCSTSQITIPCDGNVCLAGSEPHKIAPDDIAEASPGTDLDRQIESIRASVDLQVQ
jgi:hypothetical protein